MTRQGERAVTASADEVARILARGSVVLVRLVKPQPRGVPASLEEWASGLARSCGVSPSREQVAARARQLEGKVFPFRSPEGSLGSPLCPWFPGAMLWIREPWRLGTTEGCVDYRFGGSRVLRGASEQPPASIARASGLAWRSSMHMPRWASRLSLGVRSIRCVRVQELTAEGRSAAGSLRLGRDVNPWVWAIEADATEVAVRGVG